MAIHNKHLTLGPTGIQASFSNANQKKKKKILLLFYENGCKRGYVVEVFFLQFVLF